MKKTLAILLTLILTFSCVSILGTGVAVAEEIQEVGVNLIESDFHKPLFNNSATSEEKKNMSMWQIQNAVEYLDDNNDGTTDFARLTSTDKKANLYSYTAVVNPGNTYQISFDMRIPESVEKDLSNFVIGNKTYQIFPQFVLYQPEKNTAAGARVSSTYSAGTNDYAYSYEAEGKVIRRTDFSAKWTIGDYTSTRSGYSDFGEMIKSQYYNMCKDADGNVISPNVLLKDWTKVTMTFQAIEDDANQGPQVVAFNATMGANASGVVIDFKDFSLVCTDNGTVAKTIMTSDFNDADGTNWRYTSNDVTYCDDDDDGVNDYASVKVNANNQNAGLFSTPFNLVPGNDYELTYYIRVPEESRSFLIGSTFYAPTVAFYQPKVNSTGTKIENVPAVSTVEASNNYYAYKYTDDADATKSWARRKGFEATWTIDGYTPKVITNFSDFDYRYYTAVLGATNADLNEAFEDWTKVTVNFTALANTEDEKSQVTAVGFYYGGYKSSDNFVFDIKDVALTETAPKIKPEPDHSNAIFYEGFETTTQTELEALITNRSSWAKVGFDTNDAATGVKSASIYAMWNDLFIPINKENLDTSTYYEFSMDWKLKVPTETKQSALTKLAIVGYNPSQGETIKDNAKALFSKEILYGIGDWKNTTLRFKISDLNSYEQFGIIIKYSGSEPYDSTDTLYIDTLMIDVAEDQSDVTIIDLDEQERTDDTIKVLAFGNSFSDDATVYIDDIAKADGKDLRVANCVKGGCSLNQHYRYMLNSEAAYNFVYYTKDAERQTFKDVTMQQALAATDWDYIVVQQVSQDSGMPQTFEPYLEDLLAYFKMQCPDAEILFHTTWAYAANSDHSGFANYDNDQSTMHEAIEDAYLEASARYGYVPLIPTGEAIRIARATTMGDNLNRDGYHLNDKGRMIAALVWYETFTGISAVDTKVDLTTLTGTVGETGGATGFVTAEESAIIKAAAHEAAARFKLANETQLAIEAIGEVNADSGEAIETANALRAELNDDGLLPNLQTLIDANETFNNLEPEVPTILYSVNVSGENGYVYGNGEYEEGTDVSVTAAPYGDYQFDGWYENDVKVSDEQIYTFTITANRTLVAKFVPLVTEYIPDINSDDLVNLKDLITLAQYVANWDVTVNPAVTDVDGDGSTGLNDIIVLARYLAGWNVEGEMVSEMSAMPYEDLTDANLKTTLLAGESDYFNQSTVINKGNQALLAKTIKKAQNGENLTIASIGGSVTQGVKDADGNDRSYGKLVSEWFEETFGITVKNINAGIGSTGSNVGIYRLDANVLRYNPDLVLVDYCVNDISLENSDFIYRETYEAIIRKVLSEEIPVIAVAFGSANYSDPKRATTALTTGHIPTLLYYDVPVIDHYGALWRYVDAGVADWYKYTESEDGTKTATEDSLTKDGLHPSIAGHVMISSAINAYIESVYENLENVDTTVPALPEKTFFKDTVAYENAAFLVSNAQYSPGYTMIEATENENNAFSAASVGNSLLGTGWKCKTEGASVSFELKNVTALTLFLYQSKKEGEYGKGSIIINGETVVDNKSTKNTSSHVWPYYDVVYDTPQDITLTFVCNEGALMVPSIGVAMQP